MKLLLPLILCMLPVLAGCPSLASAMAPDEIVVIPAKQAMILEVAVPQIAEDMPDWSTERWDKAKVMALIEAMQRGWEALDAFYGDGTIPQ